MAIDENLHTKLVSMLQQNDIKFEVVTKLVLVGALMREAIAKLGIIETLPLPLDQGWSRSARQ